MKKLFGQIVRFAFVGGLSTGIDFGLFLFATEIMGIPYYVSNVISFMVSLTVSYILSMRYVFKAKEGESLARQAAMFFALSIIGLVLNQLILVLLTDVLGVYYVLSKVTAIAVVMVWNFVSKKLYYEGK